ncbi:hypothetical protein ATANTOWER_004982 [Ataeniobius toweri]|uniref:Uncharacterized protein n=1 Tax=Ataeniobius toweri TaxID=208326 RepID=A0ABU7BWS8_9TELE|nr:hypothetical protein [Ataeniobius toweri]
MCLRGDSLFAHYGGDVAGEVSNASLFPSAPPLPHLLVLAASGMSGLRRGSRGNARGQGDVEKKKKEKKTLLDALAYQTHGEG